MSLRVSSIRLRDFRNYERFDLDHIGQLVIFVGPNAVGKTNIIEAVQLLTALESFRTPKADPLIRWGCTQASVALGLEDGARDIETRLTIDERGKHFLLNGKQRPRQDLQGQLPALLFTPDDLQLVKGGPEGRRADIDALGIQASRNYLSVKRDYEKLLRQKNRLLKEEVAPGYLASVNEVLTKIGSQLMLYRLRIVGELQEVFPESYRQITGSPDSVSFEYCPSVMPAGAALDGDGLQGAPAGTRQGTVPDGLRGKSGGAGEGVISAVADGEIDAELGKYGLQRMKPEEMAFYAADRSAVEADFIRLLEQRGAEELARKTSLVGPHRDKPVFMLNGHLAHDFASQGQQRSLVIAYKLAELRVLEELVHQKPILLLDDVMSELDAVRRETLTHHLTQAAQAFVTTTNLEYFTPSLLDEAQIVSLPTTA